MLKQSLVLLSIPILLHSCSLIPEKPAKDIPGKVHREFYKNGKLKSVCQVKENDRHGICKYYTKNGILKGTAEFKMNKFHGTSTNYYESGKIKTAVEFENNKKHGDAFTYYPNGKVYIEEHYTEGRLDGIKRKHYKNGQLMMENEYYDGNPSIELKEYNEKGELILEKPTIVVKTLDRVALENKYILKISLSNKTQRVKFYFGELNGGKYLPRYLDKIDSKYGVGTFEIPVYRGTTIMKKLHIIAKRKTKLNNTQVLTRTYNLAVQY